MVVSGVLLVVRVWERFGKENFVVTCRVRPYQRAVNWCTMRPAVSIILRRTGLWVYVCDKPGRVRLFDNP